MARTRKERPRPRDGWAELLYPGRQLGLRLDLQELPERVLHAVRAYRSWEGLSHWGALQQSFQHAGYLDRVRWTLNEHLERLGVPEARRNNTALRQAAGQELEALTRLQIVIYNPDGTQRLTGPAVAVLLRGERVRDQVSTLEAMDLIPHPIFREGLLRADGTLAKLWAPAEPLVLHLDPRRSGHALALGLVLPIHWAWAEASGLQAVSLTGARLLEAAGIEVPRRSPERVWDTLRRALEVLASREALGPYGWHHEGPAWSLLGRCTLASPRANRALALAEVEGVPIEL
ncbi:MAG: hypothetical protein HY909_08875 [Deltaproteobacteria bacterium]|nr:hypothetical protein [Deltaproteobacteria bacterium]